MTDEDKKFRLAFFSAGDENTSSSRTRVFTTFRILQARGIPAEIGSSQLANVFFVQKKVTNEIIEILTRAKKDRNAIIIYDVDDFGESLWYWTSKKLFLEIVKLADVVSTGSEEQQRILKFRHGIWNTAVLPACVDYYPSAPVRTSPEDPSPLRILWFGSSGTFHSFRKYAEALQGLKDIQLMICMDKAGRTLVPDAEPFHFVPWTLEGFVSVLQSCHITCLSHEGSAIDRAKNNNKMITSIAWGVPAVVSKTSDYLRTAREAGVESATFLNAEELKKTIERLRSPQARDQYLDAAQPVIWSKYSPQAVAQTLLNLVEQTQERSKVQKIRRLMTSFCLHS